MQETLAQVGGGQPITTSTTYGYDRLHRLTGDGTNSYAYDPTGNRSTWTQGGTQTAYSYDRADRITAAGATAYTVNANGNTTARGGDDFAYDQANRLISATVTGTMTTYAYDGDGKRASETVGGVTTSYVYDIGDGLPVVLSDGGRKYVYGQGLAYSVDGSGSVQVYHTDLLGSVRALTDGSGNLVQTYQTDAFGVPTAAQGASGQPFRFTGQQQDGSNGLVYLRARYYDPQSGRFLARDPLAGAIEAPLTLNRYSYALNNPLLRADPSGLSSSSKVLGGDSDTCADAASHEICIGPIRIPLPGGPSVLGIDLFHGQDPSGGGDDASAGRGGRPVNRKGMPYPSALDPRTGKEVSFPNGDLQKVDPGDRVQWDGKARANFIAAWREKGYDVPAGGWNKYDIHHIQPREYGGTNDFWNLVPIDKGVHKEFNRFWENY